MERERRLWSAVLTIAFLMHGCTQDVAPEDTAELGISISCSTVSVKASDPEENLISDINIIIFDENGLQEENLWIEDFASYPEGPVRFTLLRNKKYSLYACANLGYRLPRCNRDAADDIIYHLAYPDEYKEGIPMACRIEELFLNSDKESITINLERLMSKISIRMDRGGLEKDVMMEVVSVKIGNCPRYVRLFRDSRIEDQDGCFSSGFTRGNMECEILNADTGNGISGYLSLYMLENMQGYHAEDPVGSDRCSFIELAMDYRSETRYTLDNPLIYRFYLGNSRDSLDIERNTHYRITVIPEEDGLTGDGWRVDKSGLHDISSAYFNMNPSGYIRCNVGDTVHVHCDFQPTYAAFDIGLEELEHDRQRGIYDYSVADDGKGVTLSMKSPGTGIIYMSAGPPINETGMLMIEVNNIKNQIL